MKKIALINSVYNQGSTGRICFELSNFFRKKGFEVKTFYGRNKNNSIDGIYFGSTFSTIIHGLKSRITDKQGFYSSFITKNFICKLEEFSPDIIMLHNLHGYYLNIKILLKWIAQKNIKVISVFHDCWNITGHCAHFSYEKCDTWKTGCNNCPCKRDYPKSILMDNSKKNYMTKKELYSNIKQLVVVCPSNWLANLIKDSFFSKREIMVINNGIDTNVFKNNIGEFRKMHSLADKKIILSIANVFDKKKGLYDVVELSKLLSDDEIIVMVGKIKNKIKLPKNIIHIERTDDVHQLVDIYSSSNVMFNPTYEDTYPTINLEALSCECPIVCYKTGGAIETVDANCVVEQGDYKKAYAIMRQLFDGKYKYQFLKKELLSKNSMFEKYLKVINDFLKRDL